ncbi:MAG: GTPase Era [Ruminococcaceae bacterium]|nr:GTPase Era [Oscillospiraceae bacterium]
MEITRTAMFSIVGRPNVGKSTLLNALTGEKIAITSSKPQTTRNRISGIVNREGVQYIFMDTPGFHKPKNKLGDFMVGVVHETVSDTDAAILVVEPRSPGKQERMLYQEIMEQGLDCVLVINKIDTINKREILAVISEYTELGEFAAVIPVCARTGDGVDILMSELEKFAEEGPALYPEGMSSDQPERVIVAEFVREKLLRLLDREIPHGIAVEIEVFDERDTGTIEIGAVIYCEKASHKGIVIGKDGAMLKKVGEQARLDMENLLGAKVFLTLWVKVREGWRDNEFFMRNFGYEQ